MRRVPKWAWWLAAALALWLGSIAFVQLRPKPPSTGDALLDLYLAHADEHGGVSLSLLDRWKPRFIHDPRYWELRYLVSTDEAVAGDHLKEIDQYITDAQERGDKLSVALITKGVDLAEGKWFDEIPRSNKTWTSAMNKLPVKEKHKLSVTSKRKTCDQVDAVHRQERDALYAFLRKAAPDESSTWNRQAELDYFRGDERGALADIERWNHASHVEDEQPFPVDVYRRNLRAAKPDPRYLSASMLSQAADLGDFITVKTMHYGLWDEALEHKDRAAMNKLHLMACRLARRDPTNLIGPLVAVVLLRYECRSFFSSQTLTPQEQSRFASYSAKLDRLRNDCRALTKAARPGFTSNPTPIKQLRMQLGGERYANGMLMEDAVWEAQQVQSKVLPQIDELAEFDFATLDWKK